MPSNDNLTDTIQQNFDENILSETAAHFILLEAKWSHNQLKLETKTSACQNLYFISEWQTDRQKDELPVLMISQKCQQIFKKK